MKSAPRIPAREAMRVQNPNASWDHVGSRLLPECLPAVSAPFALSADATVLTIGSCFARNIEEYLEIIGVKLPALEFEAPQYESPNRPNGLLNKYTPPAIWQELKRAADIFEAGRPCEPADFAPVCYPLQSGQVVDLELNGKPVSPERFLARRRQVHEVFASAFTCDCVTITFGLLECWYDNQTGLFISDAPKHKEMMRDLDRFEFIRLDHDACADYARRSIELIHRLNPRCKIIITTSPVPLARTFTSEDVILANMYGKSVLRSVSQGLALTQPLTTYFPSYEAVMLTPVEQVFEEDLRHVKDSYVGKIVRGLVSNYFTGIPDDRLTLLNAAIDLTASKERDSEIRETLSRLTDYRRYSNSILTLLCRLAWRARKQRIGQQCAQVLAARSDVQLRHLKALNFCLPRLGATAEARIIGKKALEIDPTNERALALSNVPDRPPEPPPGQGA